MKNRRPLYAKIEIGRKQLEGMDDEDFFRDWLELHFGVRSRKELSFQELSVCIALLAKLGAEFKSADPNKKPRPHARPDWIEIPDSTTYPEMKRAICKIWKNLNYSMTSLETRVKRQFGLPSLLWMSDQKELSALLTDLQKRESRLIKKQTGAQCREN